MSRLSRYPIVWVRLFIGSLIIIAFLPVGSARADQVTKTISVETEGLAPSGGLLWQTQPPVAENQSVKTLTDWPTAIHLQASDPDDMPLTYTIVDLPSNGSLEDYEDGDALLTYFSNLDFTGEDSFTFKVSNGLQESNLATVSIAVVDALSWTPQSRVNDIAPGGSVDFPAVALQGNTAYAAWYASERNGDIGIFFNKSLDGGVTWGPDDRFVSPVTLDNVQPR